MLIHFQQVALLIDEIQNQFMLIAVNGLDITEEFFVTVLENVPTLKWGDVGNLREIDLQRRALKTNQ